MGVGELVGLRWILWGDTGEIPAEVFDATMRFVLRGLGAEQDAAASRSS
jgi:hypothetical protein